MHDEQTTVYYPDEEEYRVCVSLRPHGVELRLYFADLTAEGPVLEVRVLPGDEELTPETLRRLIPLAPQYAQYARAAVLMDSGEAAAAVQALRKHGGPRRGLSDRFYEIIADQYHALVAENDPHPVTAISQIHGVTVSGASRWITEARRRGLIRKEADHAR